MTVESPVALPAKLPAPVRRSILLLSFSTFSSMSAQRICDAMLPELSREFGVSLSQAAQVVSAFAVVYGLSQLFYGPMGDRLGKYRVVTFTTLGCSVGSAMAFFASSLEGLVLARVLVALGAAAIIPLSLAWVGDAVAYERRQETLARLGFGSTLGIVSGQLFGGLMTDWVGWRWAFALMTVMFSLVGGLLWRELRRQQREPLAMAHAAAPGPRPGFVTQALSIVTGEGSRLILLIALIEGAMGFGVLAIWASHLHQALSLSLTASGGIVGLYGLGGMLYMLLARFLIPRLGEHGLALAGTGILALCTAVIGFTPYAWTTLPASLLGGFGFFMFHNTMQTHATQMAPAARGTAVSLFASLLFMGQAVGVLLAAALVGWVGSGVTIALGGGVLWLIGALFAWRLHQRQRRMLTQEVGRAP